MNYRIVSDSASDLLALEGVDFRSVPLHVIVDGKDFTDDGQLDLDEMQRALDAGRQSSTACPAVSDWLEAFEGADRIFCVTITSGLSGSYNSAVSAKEQFEEQHPDAKVYLVDSLATASKMVMLCEYLRDMIQEGLDADEIERRIRDYQEECTLGFMLASLDNLVKNGRVNPLLAKCIKVLNVRIVGTADEEGKLKPLAKCRGEKRAVKEIIEFMRKNGYRGGRVVITHNGNHEGALHLKNCMKKAFGTKSGEIRTTRGLCSYYAEPGSFTLAFDRREPEP